MKGWGPAGRKSPEGFGIKTTKNKKLTGLSQKKSDDTGDFGRWFKEISEEEVMRDMSGGILVRAFEGVFFPNVRRGCQVDCGKSEMDLPIGSATLSFRIGDKRTGNLRSAGRCYLFIARSLSGKIPRPMVHGKIGEGLMNSHEYFDMIGNGYEEKEQYCGVGTSEG